MDRRDFIKFGGAGAALMAASPKGFPYHEESVNWRGFRFSYYVELPSDQGQARLWLPMPWHEDNTYQRSVPGIWNGKPDKAAIQNVGGGQSAFVAEWRGKAPRTVTVSTIIKTADRHAHLDAAKNGSKAALPKNVLGWLKPTKRISTDGIVRSTAQAATKGASSPLEEARAIYDWVVENVRYDANIRGCGQGDPKAMLQSGRLSGRSADFSALFVALCRASGVPARELYGIRVDDSELFKSLGVYGDVSRGQHCRAEFYVGGAGWVPVNPSDVRRAVEMEGLPLSDPKIVKLRDTLFGTSEMNWFVFNYGDEVSLPGSSNGSVPFFAFPQAELGSKKRDSLDPVSFSYRIESRELVGTGVKF